MELNFNVKVVIDGRETDPKDIRLEIQTALEFSFLYDKGAKSVEIEPRPTKE